MCDVMPRVHGSARQGMMTDDQALAAAATDMQLQCSIKADITAGMPFCRSGSLCVLSMSCLWIAAACAARYAELVVMRDRSGLRKLSYYQATWICVHAMSVVSPRDIG